MTCKTPEEIAEDEREKILLEEQARIEAELAAIEDERRKRAEDDLTDISEAPISIPNEDSEATCKGLFIPEWQAQTSEDTPLQEITIRKDKLLRIPEGFLARFEFHLDAPGKIVGDVYLDGKPMGKDEESQFGTNFPFHMGDGYIDIPLPEWPGTAKALKAVMHELSIRYGMITGITYGNKGVLGLLTWGMIKAQKQAIFKVTILPSEFQD